MPIEGTLPPGFPTDVVPPDQEWQAQQEDGSVVLTRELKDEFGNSTIEKMVVKKLPTGKWDVKIAIPGIRTPSGGIVAMNKVDLSNVLGAPDLIAFFDMMGEVVKMTTEMLEIDKDMRGQMMIMIGKQASTIYDLKVAAAKLKVNQAWASLVGSCVGAALSLAGSGVILGGKGGAALKSNKQKQKLKQEMKKADQALGKDDKGNRRVFGEEQQRKMNELENSSTTGTREEQATRQQELNDLKDLKAKHDKFEATKRDLEGFRKTEHDKLNQMNQITQQVGYSINTLGQSVGQMGQSIGTIVWQVDIARLEGLEQLVQVGIQLMRSVLDELSPFDRDLHAFIDQLAQAGEKFAEQKTNIHRPI